jgi:GNAT superfamily N-acetyltransferase
VKPTFTQATAADAELLAEMFVEFEEAMFELVGKRRPRNASSRLAKWRKALSATPPYFDVMIVLLKGKPVGYTAYVKLFNMETGKAYLYMHDLFIRSSARGKRVGEALMRELETIARAKGCADIYWDVWHYNPKALGFYLKIGAKPESEMIRMRWKLKAGR